jgi:hypothetical protein
MSFDRGQNDEDKRAADCEYITARKPVKHVFLFAG